MTEGVEKVPLSAVEETNTSKSKETDEVDLDDFSDNNIVVTGSEEPEEVEISFSNIEKVSGLTAEDIREELKSLKNKPIEDVTIEIDGKRGRIALENINIGESSDTPTYHEGSISGTFLPWPKHFTNNRPKLYKILNSDSFYFLNLQGDSGVLVSTSGDFYFEFLSEGQIGQLLSVQSDFSGTLSHFDGRAYGENYGKSYSTQDVPLSLILSLIGQVDGKLDLSDRISLVLSLSSSSSYSLDLTSTLLTLVDLKGSLSMVGSTSGSLSSLVSTSATLSSNGSLSSDLSQLQSVSSSLGGVNSLSGDISGFKALSTSVTTTSTSFSSLSTLVGLSTSVVGNNTLSGDLEFSSVAYGSKYGSDYGSPSTIVYGDNYGSTYGSPTNYGAGYGNNYGS